MQADCMGLCSYVARWRQLKDWCNPYKFISIYQLPVHGYTAPPPPFLPFSLHGAKIYH